MIPVGMSSEPSRHITGSLGDGGHLLGVDARINQQRALGPVHNTGIGLPEPGLVDRNLRREFVHFGNLGDIGNAKQTLPTVP
jgi:hypothetical protein